MPSSCVSHHKSEIRNVNLSLSQKKKIIKNENVQSGLNDYLFFFEIVFFLIILKTRNTSLLLNKKWSLKIKKILIKGLMPWEKRSILKLNIAYSDNQKTME